MKTPAWQKKQKTSPRRLAHMVILAMLFSAALLMLAGCGDQSASTVKTNAPTTVPIQKLATEPATGTLGLIYFNTTENREYIYTGAEWVPHDASIDTFLLKRGYHRVDLHDKITQTGGFAYGGYADGRHNMALSQPEPCKE